MILQDSNVKFDPGQGLQLLVLIGWMRERQIDRVMFRYEGSGDSYNGGVYWLYRNGEWENAGDGGRCGFPPSHVEPDQFNQRPADLVEEIIDYVLNTGGGGGVDFNNEGSQGDIVIYADTGDVVLHNEQNLNYDQEEILEEDLTDEHKARIATNDYDDVSAVKGGYEEERDDWKEEYRVEGFRPKYRFQIEVEVDTSIQSYVYPEPLERPEDDAPTPPR